MITRKFFFITLLAMIASLAGFSQGLDEGATTASDPVKKVELYPNPATEFLNVKFEIACAKRIKYTVHNVIGNTIEVESEFIDEHELQLKVKDLPVGYYLLSLRDPETNIKSIFRFLKR